MENEQTKVPVGRLRFVIAAIISVAAGLINSLIYWDSQLIIPTMAMYVMGFWLCDIFSHSIPERIYNVRFPLLRLVCLSVLFTAITSVVYDVYPFVQTISFFAVGIDSRLTYLVLEKKEQS